MSLEFELGRAERISKDLEVLMYPLKSEIRSYKIKKSSQKDGFCCPTDDWEDYNPDLSWNEKNAHRWFRTIFEIPSSMDGKHVELKVTTGREGGWDATNPQMLFYLNEKLVQGLDVNHREVIISMAAKAGERYQAAFLAYSGSEEGALHLQTELVAVDDRVKKLYYDILVPLESAYVLRRSDEENYRRVLKKLSLALDCLDLRKAWSDKFYQSVGQAEQILTDAFYSEIREEAPVVSAIGHTHIDIAWLWSVEQTREKVLRSFSTVLRLMERYPDYKFMSSQPILYQFVKEQEPEMYEEIKERVRQGRWEVDGAMWLEADCNLPEGESLVRQLMKGYRFFKEEFHIQSKSLWLPDVFGYPASLPQILKKSGIPYFMTTKITWNQYNQPPNDTFIWRGIDGSEVFTFMPTTSDFKKNQGLHTSSRGMCNTTTYTGVINPNMMLGTYKRFQNKDLTKDTLMLFGYGDGGGGPTREMLENADRLQYGIPGIPRIKLEREQDYFDRTYNKITKLPGMPSFEGELYFEYHRGTLTSMAKNKRNNRKNEILYMQLETALCMAGREQDERLKQVIRRGWDILLLNQFHDIIPGTCIEEVYEQTDREYREIRENGEKALGEIADTAMEQVPMKQDGIVVMNTQGYERNDIVFLETWPHKLPDEAEKRESYGGLCDEAGNPVSVQRLKDGRCLFLAENIPPLGYRRFYKACEEQGPAGEKKGWDGCLENDFFRVLFNQHMEIVSLYEKASQKEFFRENRPGNLFVTYEDRPMDWDNWDIDAFYMKKPYKADWYSDVRLLEDGPVCKVLEFECGFMDSLIRQQVWLYYGIPRIDFKTKAVWKEHHVLLKVHFPVEVNAVRASYEIQFGNVERETTNNTSWDTAKFEVCGHKWADLSENNSGISLLNDCKYGYGIKKRDMSLTLIKAGTYPNKNADIGEHEFTYSIYPHAGRWQEAETVSMAYNLNVPLLSAAKGKNQIPRHLRSFLTCDKESCFTEVIKPAEDRNGLIVRMYENKNNRVLVSITAERPLKQVFECSLMEQDEREIITRKGTGGKTFGAEFKPYEIKAFRLIFD